MIGGSVTSNGLVFCIDSFNNKSYNVPLDIEFIDDSIPYTLYAFNTIREVIYNEYLQSPIEWSVSTNSGTINLSSTSNTQSGTKSVELTNTPNNSSIVFISNNDISNAIYLRYYIRNKSNQLPSRRLKITLYDSSDLQIGNFIEVYNGLYNYVGSDTTTWQLIEIPIINFNILSNQIHKIEITKTGIGTSNVYLDYFSIEYSQHPTVIGISGDYFSNWNTYLSFANNNEITLNLNGGLISEDYIVNKTNYDSISDITIIYNQSNNPITVSYSCVIDDLWSGGTLYIKVLNNNLSKSFNLYTYYTSNEITLQLSGGVDGIETSYISPYFLPFNNLYIPSVSGTREIRWNEYISSNNGLVELNLNSTLPQIYSASNVTLDSYNLNTLLYSFPTHINLVKYCYIDSSYTGFDCIVMIGDFSRSMDLYTQNGINQISFNLTLGAIPETYLADSYHYDGTNTYIFSSDNTPTLYNDHSQFELYVENIVEFQSSCIIDSWGVGVQSIIADSGIDIASSLNLYNTPITVYLSGGAIPETYLVDAFTFDGYYTYIYDSAYLGTLYNDHTKMTIMQQQPNGEQYIPDYTQGTYIVFSQDETLLVKSGFYYDGTDTYIYDDSGLGLSYSQHTYFSLITNEVIGTQYTDHTNIDFNHVSLPPTQVGNLVNTNQIYSLINNIGFNRSDFILDGTNDYINIGNLGNGFQSFTLDFWFNSSSIINYRNILDFNGGNLGVRFEQSNGFSAAWINGTGNVRLGVVYNGIGELFGIGGNLTKGFGENEWVNIILTNEYSTKRVKFFLNGEKIIDNTTPGFFHGVIGNLRIGVGFDSGRFFKGLIPYVAIYNRTLTEQECLSNYDTLKWRFI